MSDNNFSNPVTAALIGAGNRGTVYASYSKYFPTKLKIVAVAEPKSAARDHIANLYNISSKNCFSDWRELARVPKLADCVIIATNDREHKNPTVAFAKLKYDILLEKPMAVDKNDCLEIVNVCEENDIALVVCHVLRYLPSVLAIKKCIQEKIIGDVVNIEHTERVGFWHFAHSFVRGNWSKTNDSSFSLLTKCGHDVDLIKFWMEDKKCLRISSFGSLFHFSKEKKPSGAGERCLTCDIEESCAYSAKKIYLDSFSKGLETSWPYSVVCLPCENYEQNLIKALEVGPYGRCVYSCDNDVCDNQTVQFQYHDGSTSTLTMIAFTEKLCLRETKVYGTLGELFWDGENEVVLFDFLTRKKSILPLETNIDSHCLGGHGGADFYLMESFVNAVRDKSSKRVHTTSWDALESHLLVFAAEESRINEAVVDYQKFRKECLK